MNAFQDRGDLRLLHRLLPKIVGTIYYAEPGSPLEVVAEACYERLLIVRQQLVRDLEDEYGECSVASMRPPESQRALLRDLIKAVRHTIMHAGATGALISELQAIHVKLLAVQEVL